MNVNNIFYLRLMGKSYAYTTLVHLLVPTSKQNFGPTFVKPWEIFGLFLNILNMISQD